jgi:PKD repeat protein
MNGQVWYLDANGNGSWGSGDKACNFGAPGWTPSLGDWDGDTSTEIGVYKDGTWYLDRNGDGTFNAGDSVYSFGLAGWSSVVGDWDGDARTDIGVYKDGVWYLDRNGNGVWDSGIDKASEFGSPGWTPIIGDWNRNDTTKIGVTNGQLWYLDVDGDGMFNSINAQFAANTTQGRAPLTVQFTDKSVSAGTTSYKWDINNDGIVDYTTRNPVLTYQTAGNYTVKLTVTNPSGSDTEVKTNYIQVTPSPAIAPASCLSAPVKAQLDKSWDRKKDEIKQNFNSALAGGNPIELYNIQVYTNNLLDETAKCQDYTTLNELVGIYNSSYRYLSVTPEGREWLCGAQCETGSGDDDLDPANKGKEVELYSQQYMFLVSRTLNIIASMDERDKTPEMKAFTRNFGPLAVESYLRWRPVNLQKVQRKLTVPLSEAGLNDAINDRELWMAAGIVELLAANTNDPTIRISDQQRASLLEYVHTMNRLVQSRLTQTNLNDFAGTPVKGVIIDYGVKETHPEYRYACYTGITFPTLSDQCTAKTGLDIGHSMRYVKVFETLYHNRKITGDSFPDKAFMTSLANELVYGSSNRNTEKPLFTNYFGGMNGWYRVGFHSATFGYPPYGLTSYVPEGGYGYWAEYNSDVGVLMQSLLKRSANLTKDGTFQDPFMLKYYPALQWDYGKIRFLPSFAIG